MKNNISPREYEQLSAYLDEQLNERDQARLEARLQSSPELSSALDDLRQTRQLLRSLPPMKAPRSFKLTPEMVGQTRRPRLIFPVFQFASALATLLLVLVLAGDLFGFQFGAAQTANAPVAMQQEQPAIATEQAFTLQAAQPTLPPGPAAAAPMLASPTGTPGPDETRKSAGLAPEATVEATAQALSAGSPSSITSTNPLSETAPIAPQSQPGGLVGAAGATTKSLQDNATQASAPASQPFLPPLRIAEIVLAIAAVGFGITAYVLRRSTGV